MVGLTTRINIHGLCRTYELWSDEVSAEDLDGVEAATWQAEGESTVEQSFRVDEGETERNVPYYTFNILQAAEADPRKVREIIHDEAPTVSQRYDLDEIDVGTTEWFKELVEVLVYLSIDRSEDYGQRYWFLPWQKAKELNPDLLTDGQAIVHPGKDAVEDDEQDGESAITNSAAYADW